MIDYREKLTSIRLNERTLANEPNNYVSDEPRQNKGRWLVNRKLDEAPPSPVILLSAVPRRLFCFGSLVVLDVMCGYLLYFLLDIKIGNK